MFWTHEKDEKMTKGNDTRNEGKNTAGMARISLHNETKAHQLAGRSTKTSNTAVAKACHWIRL
jgi:hypothetical protein